MRIGLVVAAASAAELAVTAENCRSATTQAPHWYVAAWAETIDRAGFARFVVERPATLWLYDAAPRLPAALNTAVLAAAADASEVTILLDPEVAFEPGGLDRFVAFVLQQEVAGVVLALSPEPGAPVGCAAIGPAAYNWLGALDENIDDAGLALADYLLRAKAASIPVATDANRLLRGAAGSVDSAAAAAAGRYFAAKWGGAPGATTLSRPFGRFGSRIDWAARGAPYGTLHDQPAGGRATPPALLVSRMTALAGAPGGATEGAANGASHASVHGAADASPNGAVSAGQAAGLMAAGPAQQAAMRAAIRAVYQALLERDPEEAVYAWYVEALGNGSTTLAGLCEIVRGSEEHRNRAADHRVPDRPGAG